jgi:hypothetical protein
MSSAWSAKAIVNGSDSAHVHATTAYCISIYAMVNTYHFMCSIFGMRNFTTQMMTQGSCAKKASRTFVFTNTFLCQQLILFASQHISQTGHEHCCHASETSGMPQTFTLPPLRHRSNLRLARHHHVAVTRVYVIGYQ